MKDDVNRFFRDTRLPCSIALKSDFQGAIQIDGYKLFPLRQRSHLLAPLLLVESGVKNKEIRSFLLRRKRPKKLPVHRRSKLVRAQYPNPASCSETVGQHLRDRAFTGTRNAAEKNNHKRRARVRSSWFAGGRDPFLAGETSLYRRKKKIDT